MDISCTVVQTQFIYSQITASLVHPTAVYCLVSHTLIPTDNLWVSIYNLETSDTFNNVMDMAICHQGERGSLDVKDA